jgi:hypothetical protein
MTDFEEIGIFIGKIVAQKNAAYGNSFAIAPQMLQHLYPEGVKPEQYRDVLTIVRVIDKLKRIATDRDALGENPWMDIAGYAILAIRESPRRFENVSE